MYLAFQTNKQTHKQTSERTNKQMCERHLPSTSPCAGFRIRRTARWLGGSRGSAAGTQSRPRSAGQPGS